ncbi:MAG: O-antigen ligase family protein [Clostridia bacterium]|nr:O-antigen ligase family protein [Clostridia bacterium]
MTPTLARINDGIKRYLSGDAFMLTVAAVVLIFWATQQLIAGLIVLVLLASLAFLYSNTAAIIPLILFGPCVVSIGELPSNVGYLFLMLIPLVAAILFHIIKYKGKGIKKVFNIKGNVLPLILFAFAIIVSGAFSPARQNKVTGLILTAYLGILPLIIYLIVRAGYDMRLGDIRRYTAKAMMVWGLLITLEATILYLTDVAAGVNIISNDYVPRLGWGVSNLYCTAILTCIPFNFYFLNKHYRWALPMIALTVAECAVVALSHSRGALIFTGLTVMLSLIASLFRYRRNKIIWLCFSLCALAVIFAISRYGDAIKHLLAQTFEDKLGASSRDFLYLEALDRFRENPLFGAGAGYIGYRGTNSIVYLFHSTLFQTVGMMGVVGIVAMVYLYVMRYYTVLRKKDSFNLFLCMGLIGFEGYSMIDTGTFNAIPFLVMLAVLMAATELSNEQLDNRLLIEKQNYNDRLSQVVAGADNEEEK